MRTAGGPAGDDARFDSGFGLIRFGKLLRNLRHFCRIDQRHRAAPESAAGHSRTNDATFRANLSSKIDEQIEFWATYFVIVAKRIVTGVHKRADLRPLPRLDGSRCFDSASNFSDSVPSAAVLSAA